MENKVIYTPFISKPFELPESQAIAPIPISFPIPEYRGANPDRKVIPIYDVVITSKQEEHKPSKIKDSSKETPLNWAREQLSSKYGKKYSDKKKFKEDLKNAYEKELTSRGISKEYADYIVAQDALESGWGSSSLSEFYNFGGVKETREGKGVQKKTKESYDGKILTDTVDSFRQFDSLDDYVKYKIDLLGNSNYNVFAYRPDQLYNRLVTAKNKYATDPNYEKKLNSVYRTYLAV